MKKKKTQLNIVSTSEYFLYWQRISFVPSTIHLSLSLFFTQLNTFLHYFGVVFWYPQTLLIQTPLTVLNTRLPVIQKIFCCQSDSQTLLTQTPLTERSTTGCAKNILLPVRFDDEIKTFWHIVQIRWVIFSFFLHDLQVRQRDLTKVCQM